MKRRRRSAWLVTWDWAGDHARPDGNQVLAVLSPRLGERRVKELVEALCATHEYDSVDMFAALDENPYPARYDSIDTSFGRTEYRERITCGHNPWLLARKVVNLRLGDAPDTLAWDEVPTPQ